MDPIAGAALVGQAATAFLKRSRVAVSVNEDYDTFDDRRVKKFFFPVDAPERLTTLRDQGSETVYSKPYSWVRENKGYELGHTVFEFAIQSLNATVALIGGKPIVDRDIAETRGIAILPPPAGGPLSGRYLSVSLDEARVDCRDGDNLGAPSVPFRFDIPQGTTELFRVHAYTSQPVMWSLRLLFMVNGRKVEYDLRRESEEKFVTLPYTYAGITDSFEWRTDHWEPVPPNR
jgi:hypothetical protein